jgi:hypothetical protein
MKVGGDYAKNFNAESNEALLENRSANLQCISRRDGVLPQVQDTGNSQLEWRGNDTKP